MVIQESLDKNCDVSIYRACRLLGVSKSGFYKWCSQLNSDPLREDSTIRKEIQNIAIEFPSYGYRRITVELRNRGYSVNHKRVLGSMREGNLLYRRKKFKPLTTNSNHNLKKYPNLTLGLEVTRLNQVWAADITYIHLPREYVYLAFILVVHHTGYDG